MEKIYKFKLEDNHSFVILPKKDVILSFRCCYIDGFKVSLFKNSEVDCDKRNIIVDNPRIINYGEQFMTNIIFQWNTFNSEDYLIKKGVPHLIVFEKMHFNTEINLLIELDNLQF